MKPSYTRTILYAYANIDAVKNQIDDFVERKALMSMSDFSPCIEQCEKMLEYTAQKVALIELKEFVDVDDYRLGAWKLESTFKRGRYLRQKAYIEEGYDGQMNVTIAGLPKKLGEYVNFDNFNIGFSILASDKTKEHKLTYRHVKGGVLLEDTDFTIH